MAPIVPKSAASKGQIKVNGVGTKSKNKIIKSKVVESKLLKSKVVDGKTVKFFEVTKHVTYIMVVKPKVAKPKAVKSKVAKGKTYKYMDSSNNRLKFASWSGTPPTLPSGFPMAAKSWDDALNRGHSRVYRRLYLEELEKRKNKDSSAMTRKQCVDGMKDRRGEIRADAIKGLMLGSNVGRKNFKVLAADYVDPHA